MGKTDAMRIEAMSGGGSVQSMGWGANTQAKGAVYRKTLAPLKD